MKRTIHHALRRLVAGALPLAICAAAWAQKTPQPWEHLRAPAFEAAYANALGTLAKTRWLARRDGPAPAPSYQAVAQERFVMSSFCKPQDCADHNAVILYAPATGAVYGTVHQKGRTTLLGHPSPAIAEALARLWKQEWHSRPG